MKLICELLTSAVPLCHPSVSAGLPAAVSAADLQFALQSLEEVGQISVTREGTCAGYSWSIKWRSTCGKQNLLQVPLFGLVSIFFYVLRALCLIPKRIGDCVYILKMQTVDYKHLKKGN